MENRMQQHGGVVCIQSSKRLIGNKTKQEDIFNTMKMGHKEHFRMDYTYVNTAGNIQLGVKLSISKYSDSFKITKK